ncbi:MAG: sulfur carrier protein ThiS [Planctomycetes bacterium]|nr:sulfur carrier protein ThiS [Planctomycetota bacterium]
MQINLNGQQKDVAEGLTISDLLGELQLKGPLAVEMNQQIRPQNLHPQTTLKPGDILAIVTMVGGG